MTLVSSCFKELLLLRVANPTLLEERPVKAIPRATNDFGQPITIDQDALGVSRLRFGVCFVRLTSCESDVTSRRNNRDGTRRERLVGEQLPQLEGLPSNTIGFQ